MRKDLLLPVLLSIILLTMFGCQRIPTKDNEKAKNAEIPETITEIIIGYGTNSYVVILKDKEEIAQLINLFNAAEFIKSDELIQQPYLSISFSGEKSSTLFHIDDKNVIERIDGSYVKSKQIHFKDLYSVFNKNTK